MIGMPIGLAIYLTHKFNSSWRLWWIGGFTFILSQIVHIPFNSLLLNPQLSLFNDSPLPKPLPLILSGLALGLSAGIFEEFARYAMYRWWAKDARSWRSGLLAGAGHGGMEAILLGGLVLAAFVQLFALQDVDLSKVVALEQLALARQQVEAYWSADWYDTLWGALERLFTIPFHLAASIIVLQAFTRRKIRWLWLAIAWHAVVDASAVVAASRLGIYLTEAIIGMFALVSLLIIFRLKQPEPVELVEDNLIPIPSPLTAENLRPVEENHSKLDNTRYDTN